MRLRLQKKGLSNVQLLCSSLNATLTLTDAALSSMHCRKRYITRLEQAHCVQPALLCSAGASLLRPALSHLETAFTLYLKGV